MPSRGYQPGARVARLALAGPAFGSDREGLLHDVLGQIEVTEIADHRSQHPAPLVAKDLLDQLGSSTIGRSSTAPPRRMAGARRASSNAASTWSTSST